MQLSFVLMWLYIMTWLMPAFTKQYNYHMNRNQNIAVLWSGWLTFNNHVQTIMEITSSYIVGGASGSGGGGCYKILNIATAAAAAAADYDYDDDTIIKLTLSS